MKQREEQPDAAPGFQIAPMIDVVFVIMLFFMVMAGAVKVEHELKTTLPATPRPPRRPTSPTKSRSASARPAKSPSTKTPSVRPATSSSRISTIK